MGVPSRIGVALDSDLLDRSDDFVSGLRYTNRSEALRDLIRDRLVVERTENPNATVVEPQCPWSCGTVTTVADEPGLPA